MLYVLRQKRRFRNPAYSSNIGERAWLPVARYDNDGHYRGAAYFDTKEEAAAYMELYNRKLIEKELLRDGENKHFYIGLKSEIALKIFAETKIPVLGMPSTAKNKFEYIQEQAKEQKQLLEQITT